MANKIFLHINISGAETEELEIIKMAFDVPGLCVARPSGIPFYYHGLTYVDK